MKALVLEMLQIGYGNNIDHLNGHFPPVDVPLGLYGDVGEEFVFPSQSVRGENTCGHPEVDTIDGAEQI